MRGMLEGGCRWFARWGGIDRLTGLGGFGVVDLIGLYVDMLGYVGWSRFFFYVHVILKVCVCVMREQQAYMCVCGDFEMYGYVCTFKV